MQKRSYHGEGLFADVAVRYENIQQPVFLCQPCSFQGEFIEHGRFGIGVGNGAAAAADSVLHDFCRAAESSMDRHGSPDLGDAVVLAVAAAKVAADRSD